MKRDEIRFRVERTRTSNSPPCFFLVGEILEGEVHPGMVVTDRPFYPDAFRGVVDMVETTRGLRGSTEVALGFHYLDAAELQGWWDMPWSGRILTISPELQYPCPCCGFRTLEEPGCFEICDVCGWDDDFRQYRSPDFHGGANTRSLNEARAEFLAAHPHLRPRGDG